MSGELPGADTYVGQPLAGFPTVRELPADLHDLAARWHDLEEREQTTMERLSEARADLDAADARDREELLRAVDAGESDPGTPHRDEALRQDASVRRELGAVRRLRAQTGRDLVTAFRERRSAFVELAREKVGPAVDRVENALAEADAAVAALVGTTGYLTFVQDLDRGDEVGMAGMRIPGVNATETRQVVAKLREALDALEEPEDDGKASIRSTVNGVEQRISPSHAASQVASGTAEWATEEDAHKYGHLATEHQRRVAHYQQRKRARKV